MVSPIRNFVRPKEICISPSMRIAVLLSILFLYASCRNADSGYSTGNTNQYIYYNKWTIPNEYFETVLKDQPKEVITRSYTTSDSSMQEPEHQLYDEYVYRFDSSGNCIYLMTNTFNDHTEVFYNYTDSGPQLREDTLLRRGTKRATIREERSKALDQHSYRTQTYVHKELTETSVTSFDAEGKVTITWPPSDPNMESELRWYNVDGRMIKKVEIDEGEADTTHYYRDKNSILQSIVGSELRYECQNNEKGDPVIRKNYRNNRLYSVTRLKYQYDAHGNWIKCFSISEPTGNSLFVPGELQVREIKYIGPRQK
jgi:hypothetical protein